MTDTTTTDSTKSTSSKKNAFCSFCRKSYKEVGPLVEGPSDQFICRDCVDLCDEILLKEARKRQQTQTEGLLPKELPTPRKIFDQLSEKVIGQDSAKKVLSVACHKHYKRIESEFAGEQIVKKDVVLLVGPSGTGKTLLARTLSEVLSMPMAMSDATTLTESGYVGEDVESVLLRLLEETDMDTNAAARGIIYIDEIDKIRRTRDNVSITRDVSGEGVQQALLTIIEGTMARVPQHGSRKHPEQAYVHMDTSDVLFVLGGSFEGIENIVLRRMQRETSSSVNMNGASLQNLTGDARIAAMDEIRRHITPEDLIAYGFLPELAGRISKVVALNGHTKKDLMDIFYKPTDSLASQFENYFRSFAVDLAIEDAAVAAIAAEAARLGTGARGLRAILEHVLLETMFELPGRDHITRCVVDADTIKRGGQPLYYEANGSQVILHRDQIFFCYARRDAEYLNEFTNIISPLLRNGSIDVWFDGKIKPSVQWRSEIDKALSRTSCAILFVSPNFLSSKFVMEEELPYLLEKAKQNEVSVSWILLGPCLYEETDIPTFQALHDVSQPLDDMEPPKRRAVWTDIGRQVKDLASPNGSTGRPE